MSSHSFAYKSGHIHVVSDKTETITVSVDRLAFPVKVKSVRAAKLAITKHIKTQERKAVEFESWLDSWSGSKGQ